VTLNTILGSRFCAPIREEVESWQRRLILLSDTLDEWLNCQKQWMYLEVCVYLVGLPYITCAPQCCALCCMQRECFLTNLAGSP
jgi:hypothetical protein